MRAIDLSFKEINHLVDVVKKRFVLFTSVLSRKISFKSSVDFFLEFAHRFGKFFEFLVSLFDGIFLLSFLLRVDFVKFSLSVAEEFGFALLFEFFSFLKLFKRRNAANCFFT